MNFFDLDHANSRLSGSIIRLGNVPILVTTVERGSKPGTYRLYYSLVGSKEQHYTYFPNRDINLKPVPLGLLIQRGEVISVSRIPARMWKIGLTSRNMELRPMPGLMLTTTVNHIMVSQELANTIMGIYPTYEEAKKVNERGSWSAFGRDFAIGPEGQLVHRFAGQVGTVDKYPILDKGHQYLSELLAHQYGGKL